MQQPPTRLPKVYLWFLAAVGVFWIVGIVSYSILPDRVAIHWSGMPSRPDGYAGKGVVAFALPAAATLLLLVLGVVGLAMRMAGEAMALFWDLFMALTFGLVLLLFVGLLVWNMGTEFNYGRMAAIATGSYVAAVPVGLVWAVVRVRQAIT